jgi:hypothetical protein
MVWITHGVTRPPDCSATEYPTCAWSCLIHRTKSLTLASILVAVHHIAFATYTSWDKQTHFSTSNNWIWVSSTEMRQIQIQARTSQLLITHINQDINHLVSQSPPLMSTLTIWSVQRLNFEFKINWSTTKWPKTKDKLKNGHVDSSSNEKEKKNSTLPITFAKEFYYFVHILSPLVMNSSNINR